MYYTIIMCSMTKKIFQDISYTLKRHKRARCIKIAVSAVRGVVITVPPFVRLSDAEGFIIEKYDWIISQMAYVEASPVANWGSYNKYKGRSLQLVRDLVKECNVHYNFSYTTIRVKDMHTQWGSCSSDKRLNFNYRLYFLPRHLAQYIVVHELCHLEEMNHSHRFWNLVRSTLPDYRKRQHELKKLML